MTDPIFTGGTTVVLPEQQAKDVIRAELGPTERLVWSGRPRQGFGLGAKDLALIPFSLMWGGFAIFWECTVIHTKAPFFFKLWGIPFVLVGLYMIFGRFFMDRFVRTKTYYGFSNERAFIVTQAWGKQVRALQLRNLAETGVSERTDGSGTIFLGNNGGGAAALFMQHSRRGVEVAPSFDMIDQVRNVYDQLRQQIDKTKDI